MRTTLFILASIAALACSEDSTGAPPPPNSDVDIVSGASTKGSTAFDPNPFTISLATQASVTWANLDNTNHQITADDGSFSSGSIVKNSTYSHLFVSPGTVTYHCAIHPTMVGTIEVTP